MYGELGIMQSAKLERGVWLSDQIRCLLQTKYLISLTLGPIQQGQPSSGFAVLGNEELETVSTKE